MKRNNKRIANNITILAGLVIICAAIGMVFYFTNKPDDSEPNDSSVETAKQEIPNSANPLILRASPESGDIADHFSGNPTAKLVLIEYADYECPGCKNSDPYIKQIAKDYEDSIAFIYRNFPLSFHPNAKAAAVIAEAASLQGKFWEMNEALFENQSAWSGASSVDLRDSIFTYIAEEAGLNMGQLQIDAANPNMSKKVDFDYNLGREQKVNETPSLYLNNEKINSETWGDEQKFRTLLDAKIAELAITN